MEDLRIQGLKPNQGLLVKNGQPPLLLLLDVPPGPLPQADLRMPWLLPAGVRVKLPLAWLSAT